MKFIADNMLGKLAKYLRMIGYDTVYPSPYKGLELIEYSKNEDRVILTRNSIFIRDFNPARCLYIKSDHFPEQLMQTLSTYNLTPDSKGFFTLCLICNKELVVIPKEEVRDRVPEKVFSNFDEFWQCPKCLRIYWNGGHIERMKRKLTEILSGTKIEIE